MDTTAIRTAGLHWLIDASGCEPEALRDAARVRGLLDAVVEEMDLHRLGEMRLESFPAPGGVTGMVLLRESHLCCHTFPESGSATLDLYCCRFREDWDWQRGLARWLGAREVKVTRLSRVGVAAGPFADGGLGR